MNTDIDNNIRIDFELDASGLNCPLPILKAKKTMTGLRSGQVLCVISTDSGSRREFEIFAQLAGHEMIDIREEADKTYFIMKKAGIEEPCTVAY